MVTPLLLPFAMSGDVKEQKSGTCTIFCRKLLRVARRYPSAASLIPSMAKRVEALLKHGGAMTKY